MPLPRHTEVPGALPGEVPRADVLARLTADIRLLLVAAPSGYGKTTLLAQLARSHRGPVTWLTAGSRHAAVTRLVADLADAAERAVPGLSCGHLRSTLAGGASAAALTAALGCDLRAAGGGLLVVVDQVDHLDTDGDHLLTGLAGQLGDGDLLAVAGYDRDPAGVARQLAAGWALLLTARELAFTRAETGAYLRARGSGLDPDEVHRCLDGWPVGIGLTIAGAPLGATPDVLVRSVLDTVPEPVAAALPAAAVLEEWSEASAAELGLRLPAGWPAVVRAAGLPGTVDPGGTFRPHLVLRTALEQRLAGAPEAHRAAHRAAGNAAERRGDLLGALRHRQVAGQHREAVGLAARIVPDLRARQQHGLVRSLLERLPADLLDPGLAAYLGHALVEAGATTEGEALLTGLLRQGPTGGLAHFALGRLAARRGDAGTALRLAEDGLALEPGPGRGVRSLLERNRFYALGMLGRTVEATTLGRDLADRERAAGDRLGLAHTLQFLEEVYGQTGRQSERRDAVLQALSILAGLGLAETNGALHLKFGLAWLWIEQGEPDRAERLVAWALDSARRQGSAMESLLLARYGEVRWAQRRPAEAVGMLAAAVPAAERAGMTMFAQQTRYDLALAALLAGDRPALDAALADARERWAGDYVAMRPLRDLCLGVVGLHTGQEPADVRRRLERAVAGALPPAIAIRARAHLLELDRRDGRLDPAAPGDLEAAARGMWGVLRGDVPLLEPLLRECLARGTCTGPVTALLAGTPGPAGRRLVVLALGGFAADLDGMPVRLPSARARELLVWLALHGPASTGRIVDALWDGSADPRHRAHAKTLVRRLRAALAEHVDVDPLPSRERVYRLAPELSVRLDLTEVLSGLAGGPDDVLAALDRCAPFLPDSDAEWVRGRRAELLGAARAAAVAVLDRPPPGLAAATADRIGSRVCTLDGLDLDVRRALAAFHARRGSRARAAVLEAECRRVETEELGLPAGDAGRRSTPPARESTGPTAGSAPGTGRGPGTVSRRPG